MNPPNMLINKHQFKSREWESLNETQRILCNALYVKLEYMLDNKIDTIVKKLILSADNSKLEFKISSTLAKILAIELVEEETASQGYIICPTPDENKQYMFTHETTSRVTGEKIQSELNLLDEISRFISLTALCSIRPYIGAKKRSQVNVSARKIIQGIKQFKKDTKLWLDKNPKTV